MGDEIALLELFQTFGAVQLHGNRGYSIARSNMLAVFDFICFSMTTETTNLEK